MEAGYSFGVVSVCNFTSFLETSYATFENSGSHQRAFYSARTTEFFEVGLAIVIDPKTKRWKDTTYTHDIVDTLNQVIKNKNFTRWWTTDLRLGHRVLVNGTRLPGFFDTRKLMVAEPGEVLEDAIVREGAGDLLNKSFTVKGFPYGLNESVQSDCMMEVTRWHMLVFHKSESVNMTVLDGEVPTPEQLGQLREYLNSTEYLIVSDEDGKSVFNASAPVTSDASYTIKKAKSLVVVVDGTVTDKDIESIVAVVGDDGTAVRVVVAGTEDGRTSLIITVNEEQATSVKDILTDCILTSE